MSLTSSYNNEWTITVTNSNASELTLSSTKGAFIGNGKVGYVSSFDKIGVQKAIIGVDFDFDDTGAYKTNIVEGFDATEVQFFDNRIASSVQSVSLGTSVLHMDTGIITNTYTITNTQTNDTVSVAFDLYAVRHLPYCTVQTFNISVPVNTATLDVYHKIGCGSNVSNVEFNNNIVFNEAVSSTKGLYVLSGRGTIAGTNKQIASSSCYVLESPSVTSIVGFNVYAVDHNTCYQKLRLSNMIANTNYKIHIVTAQMTEYDFKLPLDETRRILVNVVDNLDSPSTPITKTRSAHIAAWLRMWKHNVTIEPKTGITNNEANVIQSLKKVTRYNLYNLWSSVRDGTGIEVNPSTLSLLDTNGNLFWDGDLFFVPLLTIFRPAIAKNVIESRYKNAEKASRLAAGYGYEGTKYPYTNDVVGYGNSPYWDINGPLHVFNTALLSVNVWNYYRVTLDKNWLMNKGYSILRSNAEFFASKIEIDNDGSYNIRSVFSINNVRSDNNALTNYLAKVAFKYALEASYELSVASPEAWTEAYLNLDMRYFTTPVDGIKLDDATTDVTAYDLVEQLIPVTPFYFDVFLNQNLSRDKDSVKRNLEFVEPKINSGFASHPFNTLMLTWIKAYLMCCDNTYTTAFYTDLQNVLTTNVVGVWGNFNVGNSSTDYNDLSLSSLFLLMLVTGPGTLRIRGMVTETRFYTEAMAIKVSPSFYMPNTWKQMRLTGVGRNTSSYIVLNEVYYP